MVMWTQLVFPSCMSLVPLGGIPAWRVSGQAPVTCFDTNATDPRSLVPWKDHLPADSSTVIVNTTLDSLSYPCSNVSGAYGAAIL